MRGVPTRSHYQPHYLERVWYAQVKGTTCWQPPLQREGSAVPRGRLGSERGRGHAAARQQQRLWPAPSRSARSPARHWHGGEHPPASRATSSTAGGDPRSSVKSPYPSAAPARLLGALVVQAPSRAGCLEEEMPCGAGHRSSSWAAPARARPEEPAADPGGDGSTWARLPFLPGSVPRPVFVMQHGITELVDFWSPFWMMLSSGVGLVRGPEYPDA